MEDIFGIADSKEMEKKKRTQKGTATTTPRITKQKPSIDDDDDLGFDPRKPKSTQGRKNIFEDLLEASEGKRPASAAPAMSTAGRRDEQQRHGMSRQSTDTTTENSNVFVTQARPKTSSGRRSSGASMMTNPDPLGLFTGITGGGSGTKDKDTNVTTSDMSTPKMKKRLPTADWLGVITEPAEGSQNQQTAPLASPKQAESSLQDEHRKRTVEVLKISDVSRDMHVGGAGPDVGTLPYEPNEEVALNQSPFTQHVQLLNSINLSKKASYTVLQQQESQLSMVAQVKSQERALLEMQRKQENLLQQQESQFQALLQQQIQRQQNMEDQLVSQQHRINAHIQLMMAHPGPLMPMILDEVQYDDRGSREDLTGRDRQLKSAQHANLESLQMEADIRRLELEKQHLEEMGESIKSNYEREIEMIESSFKKQIKVLEEHLNTIEHRLKSEIEDLKKFYTEKLRLLDEEKSKARADFENEIGALKQDHEDELRKSKKSHEEDLNMLKEEHRRMLDTIRQAKMMEFAVLQENGSYLETLREASSNLENATDGLQMLRDELQVKVDTLNKEREKKIEARERRVEDAERHLKLNEETAEEEKRRLMELVSTLELQLSKLLKDSSEENWLLRQKMASIEAEKAAFEREKEFTRAQLTRDEKRIAELKEQQLVEVKRMMLDLQEEREHLVVERSKIETEKKLCPISDLEKQNLEVEAALKVAQDATRQADAERERYHKLQRQLEQQRRELVDKENLLHAKEDELEQELTSFRLAERKSQEVQQKARQAEQNFMQKIHYLQQRTRELSEKEATLSQERMLITKERLVLQALKTKLSERKCTLCKMNEQVENSQQYQYPPASDGDEERNAVTEHNNIHLHNLMSNTNLVDRLLDENISESYRKLRNSAAAVNVEFLTESVLDDDSKELALHNLDDYQYGEIEATRKNTERANINSS